MRSDPLVLSLSKGERFWRPASLGMGARRPRAVGWCAHGGAPRAELGTREARALRQAQDERGEVGQGERGRGASRQHLLGTGFLVELAEEGKECGGGVGAGVLGLVVADELLLRVEVCEALGFGLGLVGVFEAD